MFSFSSKKKKAAAAEKAKAEEEKKEEPPKTEEAPTEKTEDEGGFPTEAEPSSEGFPMQAEEEPVKDDPVKEEPVKEEPVKEEAPEKEKEKKKKEEKEKKKKDKEKKKKDKEDEKAAKKAKKKEKKKVEEPKEPAPEPAPEPEPEPQTVEEEPELPLNAPLDEAQRKEKEAREERFHKEIEEAEAALEFQREMWETMAKESMTALGDLRHELMQAKHDVERLRTELQATKLKGDAHTEELTDDLVVYKMRNAEIAAEIDMFRHHTQQVIKRRETLKASSAAKQKAIENAKRKLKGLPPLPDEDPTVDHKEEESTDTDTATL